jgi:hypothetical protein
VNQGLFTRAFRLYQQLPRLQHFWCLDFIEDGQERRQYVLWNRGVRSKTPIWGVTQPAKAAVEMLIFVYEQPGVPEWEVLALAELA